MAALRRIREALVPLNATLTEPDYAGAFRTLATRHRKRSLLVIFTDVVNPRASRALIAHWVAGRRAEAVAEWDTSHPTTPPVYAPARIKR